VENFINNVPHARLHDAVHEKYVPVLATFRDHPNGDRHTELKMGLSNEWQLSGGFKGDNTWCVMVLDAVRVLDDVAYVGEWKSGKPKDTHADQRKLYALGALVKWPHITAVDVTTYYLEDTSPPQRLKAGASAADKLKALWQGRVEMMQKDSFCAPKPSWTCKWCEYSKQKGGPCPF
jgi:hypothetical protein